MRKLFSIITVMLVALTVNATVWEITPTSPRDYDNIRYCVRDNVQAGDTVLLVEAGPYTEASSIELNKNVVIMAKEGVTPVVQLANGAYFKMMNDANTKIIGLKFDGATNSTQYGIRPYDASKSSIIIEDCEFYGFTKNIITCDGANHADSVIIDKCYFHDNTRAAVYFATSNDAGGSNCCDKVKVTNTTIANISALSGAGAIDIRNNENNVEGATSVLFVDHCTFYNILGYERIVHSLKSPLVTISNCVFSQPETATNYATWAYGGEVSNCIIYNLAGHHDWSPCPTFTSCSVADPKFKDAANGDYGFSEDSPALTAASDGGAIGDPRWVPAPAPAHTYTVAGNLASVFGESWNPEYTANDMELQNDGTYKWEKTELTIPTGDIEFKVCEDHAWTNCWPSQNYVLNIAESGIYTITITFEPDNNNNVSAVATKTGSADVLPTVAMHGNFLGSWADTQNFTEAEDKATASLKLTIAAGNYEFGMRIGGSGNWTSNGVAFSRENNSAKIVAGQGNLTLAADAAGDYIFTWTYETETLAITFPEAEPELPYMAIIGDMNNWAGDELVPAEDKLTASATIHLDMNANSGYGFKVLIGDKAYCIEPGEQWYSFNRGWTSASGIDHVATDEEAFWLSIDKAGDYTFTWTIAEKKLDITFPELLNITYYFVNTPDWEKVYAYAWSPTIADWPGEEATLQLGVSKNGHNVWAYTMPENRRNILFNDGTGGEGHQTDDLTVEDGKPYFYDGVWYEALDDIATSISDTEAKTSVQKMIENGQIVIIRNGEKFNAQGQVIR